MSTQTQWRRGTNSEHATFTGALGEVTYNTTNKSLHAHDGSTAGGTELLRKDFNNIVTTTSSVGTSATAIDTFSASAYRSAKYIVSVTDVTNTEYQTSEILLVQDGTTASVVSYGTVFSGSSMRMTFTASISSGTVTLYGTGTSANNTVKLIRITVPV